VALPEQIGDAGLLFDPNNTTEMANNIIQLITDNKLRETVIEKGYLKILSFSHDKYKDQITSVVKNL